MNTLKAEKRSMDIKAKKLRREGFVTGNVFGREMKESVPVKMDKAEVDRLLKKSNKGSQIMLDIGGKQYNVLIKDIQYNPLKGQVDEIDFQALVSDEKVHSVAEVVLLNHDKVLSGVLQLQLEEIAFQAYPSALVDRVEIDAEALRIGQSVKVKDLSIAKNKEIDLITDPEATVVTLSEVHNAAVDEDSEAEE
ncbi:MAG: 50S ribosomal protein L25 [Dorea sp.]|uniref:50S ribosomal protein L25 n=1 Tax=Dorea sp. YH-dor226 TaxID=3151119 RepID=UPI003046D274|nr:50S ribosomal protein L25 [Dorea sp.]